MESSNALPGFSAASSPHVKIRTLSRIHLHPRLTEAINEHASAVLVLTRPNGFGPMSISKDPKRRLDGQASLHVPFTVLRVDQSWKSQNVSSRGPPCFSGFETSPRHGTHVEAFFKMKRGVTSA
jgi:hypothetical protein